MENWKAVLPEQQTNFHKHEGINQSVK